MPSPEPATRLERVSRPGSICGMIALCLACGACTTLAPSYSRPDLPVPPAYSAYPSRLPASTVLQELPDWRDYFSDPQLVRLIEESLLNNRDLRASLLRMREAGALYGIQRSELFPALSLQTQAQRSRVPGDLNLAGKPLIGNRYDLGVGVASWELDFWGRVQNLRDAALEQFLATEAAHRAMALSIITQVADGYLELCELDERIALAQRTIATRQQSLRIFRRRQEVGAISQLDLAQVETLLNQAQALEAQLQQTRAARLNALHLLTGSYRFQWQPLQLPPASLMPPVSAGLPSSLLTRRPDVIAAEHLLRAGDANIGAARAAFFPMISLTGSFGLASADLDRLFDSGSSSWNFLPSIVLPIWDGGRRQSNLDLATARRDSAVVAYEKTVQEAFRDVSDALAARLWLDAQQDIARNALNVQQRRSRLALLRYENGSAPFLDVLDAQRDLLSAEQQLVQVRRAILSNSVRLYAALGGGPALSTPVSDSLPDTTSR